MAPKRTLPNIVFMDFLWNTLLIFLCLFLLAYLQINIISTEEKKVDTEGVFLVIADWDDALDEDVDLYLSDPAGHLVYFRRREDGLMHLERDDLGRMGDMIEMKDGNHVAVKKNEERVVVRGIIPGEYIASLHMYRKSRALKDPTEVHVQLFGLKGTDQQIAESTVSLRREGDEGTAFRFRLDLEGNVTDINHLPKKIKEMGKMVEIR